jgi:hypothetical protein
LLFPGIPEAFRLGVVFGDPVPENTPHFETSFKRPSPPPLLRTCRPHSWHRLCASHATRPPSPPQLANKRRLPGEKLTQRTPCPPCAPRSRCTSSNGSCIRHQTRHPSSPAETTSPPPATSTQFTPRPPWPHSGPESGRPNSLPVCSSTPTAHSRTVPSALQVASRRPSAEKLQRLTQLLCRGDSSTLAGGSSLVDSTPEADAVAEAGVDSGADAEADSEAEAEPEADAAAEASILSRLQRKTRPPSSPEAPSCSPRPHNPGPAPCCPLWPSGSPPACTGPPSCAGHMPQLRTLLPAWPARSSITRAHTHERKKRQAQVYGACESAWLGGLGRESRQPYEP